MGTEDNGVVDNTSLPTTSFEKEKNKLIRPPGHIDND